MKPNPLPARIDAFLFDLDGSLVDTEPHHWRSTNAVLARHGAHLGEEDYGGFIGYAEDAFWEALKQRYGLPDSVASLADLRTESYAELIAAEPIPLLTGVAELLDLLDRHEIPRAIASAAPRDQIEAVARSSGLDRRIRVRVSGHDDVPRSKPQPDVYLEAARRLGMRAEHCLAVEDSETGIAAAVASGAFVLSVRSPSFVTTDPRGAHRHLRDLKELLPALEAVLG